MTAIVWSFAAIKAGLDKLRGKTPTGRKFDHAGALKIEQPPPPRLPPLERVERRPANLWPTSMDLRPRHLLPDELRERIGFPIIPASHRLHEEDFLGAIDMGGHDFKPLVLLDRWDALDTPPVPLKPWRTPVVILPTRAMHRTDNAGCATFGTDHDAAPICATCEDGGWVLTDRQPPPQFEECPT